MYGGQVAITPWWGSDPNLVQGGLSLTAEAVTGDFEYARAALVARVAVPLRTDMRLGLEAGAGKGWGGSRHSVCGTWVYPHRYAGTTRVA